MKFIYKRGYADEKLEEAITLSGGVVVRHPGEKPALDLQRVARLLYQAKEAGRNRRLKEENL